MLERTEVFSHDVN